MERNDGTLSHKFTKGNHGRKHKWNCWKGLKCSQGVKNLSATWNVRSLFQAGKLHDITRDEKNENKILGLSEVKWLNSDLMTHTLNTFLKIIHRTSWKGEELPVEQQFGLRDGLDTREPLLLMRISLERAHDVNKDIFLLFIKPKPYPGCKH